MAQKKKIVIEEGGDRSDQDQASKPPETDVVAKEPHDVKDMLKALEEELAAAQADASENRDRMLRMAAELDNYKKRATRELDEIKKYATENLLLQLLTVVDNLERAISSASVENQNGKGVIDGVALTLAEVMKILEKHYVRPIQALGEPFDPAYHQAMCQEACDDQPPNTVVQEFQKGYMIHDRLLRPAMVVVSKTADTGEKNKHSVDTNA